MKNFWIFFVHVSNFAVPALSTMGSYLSTEQGEPNPPTWPDSVKIIKETDSLEKIRSMVEETEDPWNEKHQTYTSDHHFSSRRYAVLFEPGTYRGVDLQVGYYTQVAGLGRDPDDVKFVDCERGLFVPALNHHFHKNGTCLDTFWRSAENFATSASKGMQWAVSQAAPLRRVHVLGDLYLHDGAAYASGGHLANSKVDGHTYAGGQQQFLQRSVQFNGGASGGAWSMVYVGCSGQVPESSDGGEKSASVTVIEKPRVRMEKPYIALKKDGKEFELHVPSPLFDESSTVGPMMDGRNEESRDFSAVRVVRSEEPVSRIQEALDQGKDVVLAPGIFELQKTIEIKKSGQVILGLGLATLVQPNDGSPCIHVASGVPGVRIAGVMLEAAERKKSAALEKKYSSLFEWGEEGVVDPGNTRRPGGLFDVFCRVGGATTGHRESIYVDSMMRLHSGSIYGDDLWLWRADHGELAPGEKPNYPKISPLYHQAEQNEFRAETGIEVFGDDITIHGLAVEHANGHQTVWKGERGSVSFYQCEFPYGVSQDSFGSEKYRGYLVDESVEEHEVHAPGIYSNFRNEMVVVPMAIEHPEKGQINCLNPFTVRLDNHFGIESIVNGQGEAAADQGKPIRLSSASVAEA